MRDCKSPDFTQAGDLPIGVASEPGGGSVGLDRRRARSHTSERAARNSPVFVEVADNGWPWMRPESQNLRFVLYDKVRGQATGPCCRPRNRSVQCWRDPREQLAETGSVFTVFVPARVGKGRTDGNIKSSRAPDR